jgi:hypothetical protein
LQKAAKNAGLRCRALSGKTPDRKQKFFGAFFQKSTASLSLELNLAVRVKIGQHPDIPGHGRIPMPRKRVPFRGCGGAKILQHMHANSTGTATRCGCALDVSDKLAEFDTLAQADLAQSIPDLWLKPHAGAASTSGNVPVDQTTAAQDVAPRLLLTHLTQLRVMLNGLSSKLSE